MRLRCFKQFFSKKKEKLCAEWPKISALLAMGQQVAVHEKVGHVNFCKDLMAFRRRFMIPTDGPGAASAPPAPPPSFPPSAIRTANFSAEKFSAEKIFGRIFFGRFFSWGGLGERSRSNHFKKFAKANFLKWCRGRSGGACPPRNLRFPCLAPRGGSGGLRPLRNLR